jgi:hypothetical protein
MKASKDTAELEQRGYTFKGYHTSASKVFDELSEVFVQLFIGDQKKKAAAYDGLVSDRVVGVATCRDVIKFVAEGMRAPLPPGAFEESSRRCGCQHADDSTEKYEPGDLARSYLAMALVLKAFPQFEGLRSEKRRTVLERLIRIFDGCPFLRVEPVDGSPDDNDVRFKIAVVDAPREADLDGDGSLSIGEYLVEEIRCQVRGTTDEQDYAELLRKSQ